MAERARAQRRGLAPVLLLAVLALGACAATPLAAQAAHRKHAKPKPARSEDADSPPYGRRDDVVHFADDLADRNGWDRQWTEDQLAQARLKPSVQHLVMPGPPGKAKDWNAYRARFIEPQRIAAGLRFWNDNADALARAESQYGVPPALVVGLIGVETYYGRLTGSYRVLDALATLSFDFPTGRSDRSGYYRDELSQFLALCHREERDCATYKGSYAGAMGLVQFMPSSIAQHAVDFDDDGHVDLATPADAIGSAARYLADYGWQRGMPTHFGVTPPADPAQLQALLAPDIVPSFTAAQFAGHGAVLSPAGQQHAGLLALVQLDNGDDPPTFVAGTQNFYVVTRYNWSSYYAMAVIQLGEVVEAERLRADAAGEPPSQSP